MAHFVNRTLCIEIFELIPKRGQCYHGPPTTYLIGAAQCIRFSRHALAANPHYSGAVPHPRMTLSQDPVLCKLSGYEKMMEWVPGRTHRVRISRLRLIHIGVLIPRFFSLRASSFFEPSAHPSRSLMSVLAQRKSNDTSEKTPPSPIVDEKRAVESETVSFVDTLEGDEALQLVGRERTAEFSEEYNRRLRRKLVYIFLCLPRFQTQCLLSQDFVIPPLCAAVYFTQFLYVTRYIMARTSPNDILETKRL